MKQMEHRKPDCKHKNWKRTSPNLESVPRFETRAILKQCKKELKENFCTYVQAQKQQYNGQEHSRDKDEYKHKKLIQEIIIQLQENNTRYIRYNNRSPGSKGPGDRTRRGDERMKKVIVSNENPGCLAQILWFALVGWWAGEI